MILYVFLFAYGTLRLGERADLSRMDPRVLHLAQGTINGKLVDLGECPGLVRSVEDQGRVRGDLFAVPQTLLNQIDAYERECGCYNLVQLAVDLDDGTSLEAYGYELAQDAGMAMGTYDAIDEGCWVAYRNAAKS